MIFMHLLTKGFSNKVIQVGEMNKTAGKFSMSSNNNDAIMLSDLEKSSSDTYKKEIVIANSIVLPYINWREYNKNLKTLRNIVYNSIINLI